MDDLDELIREADRRGIGLMLDMVFNHTSTAHEWFQRALAGDKRYQDYYIFRDGPADCPPTNWVSKFGGSAWEYLPTLGKWYLHLFDVTQADLNWENPAVRRELAEILRFWKEKGIRGFRFDVVNLISKPAVFEDDHEGDGCRFYTDGPRVHQYIRELAAAGGCIVLSSPPAKPENLSRLPHTVNQTDFIQEGLPMLLTLLQFFAAKFLYLALHLESGSFPRPLNAREEAEAFQALRSGDPNAAETIIRHNLRLVAHIVKKYYASPADQDDLISVGTIGLIKAVRTFDGERQARFSTYASKCIENEIRMHFRKGKKEGSTISLQETLETAKEESALTLSDVLQDPLCMEEDYEKQDEARRLRQLIERLDARERQILLLRYGLGGQPPLTQLETAQVVGISRSYVSRLETRALEQLRARWEQ